MTAPEISPGSWWWLDADGLERLIAALAATGYRVVGPQVADGTVVIRDLASARELPTGWLDEQDGGSYRLRPDPAAGTFDHVVGPHSLKNFLFPARETIASFTREGGSWTQQPVVHDEPPLAVIGVRACDLEALRVQDRVFMGGDHVDPAYAARRGQLFIVAVNCRRAAATCFCHSLGCGPAVGHSFDLALTEFGGGDAGPSGFACEVGSARGAEILAAVLGEPSDEPEDRGKPRRVGSEAATRSRGFHRPPAAGCGPCTPAEVARAREVPRELAARMQAREAEPGRPRPRSLDTEGIRDLLFDNLEHPRWDEVASRCLSCTNCTLVCPTCFCASVTEVADLSGDQVARERHWASCFTLDHARIHGHSVRSSTAARYRQWLTHKLAGWIDQFGTSGCTGCGRCITWCPVGIDITEEVAAIRASSGATKPAGGGA